MSPSRRQLGPFRRSVAIAAALALVVVLYPVVAPEARAATTPTLSIDGRGWGHGRGMSQYGAQGYATQHGWSYGQILSHYYGGTSVGDAGNPTLRVRLDALNGNSDVRLRASTGTTITIVAANGNTITIPSTHRYLRFRYSGGWLVSSRATTDAAWSSRGNAGHTVTARPTGGRFTVNGRTYPGRIRSQSLTSGGTRYYRTMAITSTEQYLRGVVPNESPPSWHMNALKAQAVAARSYVLAGDSRWTIGGTKYADTCDTTLCQVYNPSSTHDRTDTAISQTAGEIRRHSNGNIARTEYSSTSGGWTAGGTFPVVQDLGDSISPLHTWSVSVSAKPLQDRYANGSPLTSISVISRNGYGQWGGRAVNVRLRFANGTDVTVSGDAVRSTLGLRSDWFSVSISGGGGGGSVNPYVPPGVRIREHSVNGANYRPMVGDFDGDGISDIFWYAPGPEPDYIWWGRSAGRFTSSPVSVSGHYQTLVGDVTGNGRDDIVWYSNGASYLWRSTGSRSFASTPIPIPGNRRVFLADIGGDGKQNIVFYGPGGLSDGILTWTGSGFSNRTINVSGDYQPFVGDFDGNGSDDIFWYAPGPAPDYVWWTSPGGGITSAPVGVNGTYQPLVGDFDGSGRDDIMWYQPGVRSDYTWFGNGNRTFTSRSTPVAGRYQPIVIDMGGNGRDDILWYAPGPAPDYWWRYGTNRRHSSTELRINGSYIPLVGTFGSGRDGIFWYGPGPILDSIWYW